MAFLVIAEPRESFDAWTVAQQRAAAEPVDALAAAGRAVFEQSACVSCHTLRGTPAVGDVGPELTHLASRETLAAGLLPNTLGHLGGWLADPQALKPGSLMPAVPLGADDLRALLHYLRSLR
jgi:cytochrome c oxidase subunit 2